MKKEVKLTLIVKADIENREILSDLKTQINKCKHLYEVVDYDIVKAKDDNGSLEVLSVTKTSWNSKIDKLTQLGFIYKRLTKHIFLVRLYANKNKLGYHIVFPMWLVN